ncbi:MAG: anti-sigma factor family protein [Candidatus Zixiibacteriota bacterium]
MKCNEVENLLEAYHNGHLDSMAAKNIHAHLSECHSCSKEYEKTAKILNSLAQIKMPEVSTDFIESTLSKMQKAYQKPIYSFIPQKTSSVFASILPVLIPVIIGIGLLGLIFIHGQNFGSPMEIAKPPNIDYSIFDYEISNLLPDFSMPELLSPTSISDFADYLSKVPMTVIMLLAFIIGGGFLLFNNETFVLFD